MVGKSRGIESAMILAIPRSLDSVPLDVMLEEDHFSSLSITEIRATKLAFVPPVDLVSPPILTLSSIFASGVADTE